MLDLRLWIPKSNTDYKLLVTILPILVATLVAVTRVNDNFHFSSDVLAGGLVGILSSLFSAFQHLRHLLSSQLSVKEAQRNDLDDVVV